MKIDVTKIPEYKEGMTAEELVNLINNTDFDNGIDMSKYVSKETFDKTASSLAEFKKKLNSQLSDEEKRKEAEEAKDRRIAELERNEKIRNKALGFIDSLKCDKEKAEQLATSMVDGSDDFTELINSVINETITSRVNEQITEKLGSQKLPETGNHQSEITREDIAKMTPDEINKNWDKVQKVMSNSNN